MTRLGDDNTNRLNRVYLARQAGKPTRPLFTTSNPVVRLLEPGLPRVMDGAIGMCFPVDHTSPNVDGTATLVAVRDYRYPAANLNPNPKYPNTLYQIWSMHLGRDCEEVVFTTELDI